MSDDYIKPGTIPPQLSRADIKKLTPAEIVKAQEAGQFDVLMSTGRDPIGVERRGERKATVLEDVQAAADQQAAAKAEATHRAQAIRNALKENKR